MKIARKQKGMTLIETLVTVAIFTLIMIAVTAFDADMLKLRYSTYSSLSNAESARSILRTMARELRSTSQGNTGTFPIASPATSTITFFADTDNDGLKEQIRYFLVGKTLKRGSIKPTGSPLSYVSANEAFSTVATDVANGTSTNVFEYYDDSYDGTSAPLAYPVAVINIHLIKISLRIDTDPNRSPIPVIFTSQITLRNLKDNL